MAARNSSVVIFKLSLPMVLRFPFSDLHIQFCFSVFCSGFLYRRTGLRCSYPDCILQHPGLPPTYVGSVSCYILMMFHCCGFSLDACSAVISGSTTSITTGVYAYVAPNSFVVEAICASRDILLCYTVLLIYTFMFCAAFFSCTLATASQARAFCQSMGQWDISVIQVRSVAFYCK